MGDNNKKRVIAEFHIKAFEDGNVEIDGPFKDFIFYRQVMIKAEGAIIDFLAKQSNIVVPQKRIITNFREN